jgi:hypothetical protein
MIIKSEPFFEQYKAVFDLLTLFSAKDHLQSRVCRGKELLDGGAGDVEHEVDARASPGRYFGRRREETSTQISTQRQIPIRRTEHRRKYCL